SLSKMERNCCLRFVGRRANRWLVAWQYSSNPALRSAGGHRVRASMNLSALDLSRIQFAFTVSFHIIFPAISIGLASFLAVLEFAWLRTGKPHYRVLCRYWSHVFAVGFGMG